jgi:galactokinase
VKVQVHAPGRVNLLGEHVDYNGGWVLPAAIDLYLNLSARPINGLISSITALDLNEQVSFDTGRLEEKIDVAGNPLPAWALYPAGVCWSLRQHGFTPQAVDAQFTSQIPIGAGLSSSAALETAFGLMWQSIGRLPLNRVDLAQICQKAEVEYVGVNSGIMDQFACLNGKKDHALFLDTMTLAWEAIPLPDVALVAADTGKAHRLGNQAGEYNQRREECEQALAVLRRYMPGVRVLRDVLPADLMKYEDKLPPLLFQRARHVVDECQRVLDAVGRLRGQAYADFGAYMYASHASLRDLFEVSNPQLDALVEIASTLRGCLGARLTGAGFGGSTINLVETDQADAFTAELGRQYRRRTGEEVKIYKVKSADGAWVETAPEPAA